MADERHVERGRHLKAAQGGREQDQAAMQGTRKELWLGLAVCGQQCLPAHLPWGTASRHRSEDARLRGETDSTGKRADVEATRPDVWLKHVPWAQFFTELSPQGPSLSLSRSCLCSPGDVKVCGLSAPAVEIQL